MNSIKRYHTTLVSDLFYVGKIYNIEEWWRWSY